MCGRSSESKTAWTDPLVAFPGEPALSQNRAMGQLHCARQTATAKPRWADSIPQIEATVVLVEACQDVNRTSSGRFLLLQTAEKQVHLGLREHTKLCPSGEPRPPRAFGAWVVGRKRTGIRMLWKENATCCKNPRTGDPSDVSTCVCRLLFGWRVMRASFIPKPRTGGVLLS